MASTMKKNLKIAPNNFIEQKKSSLTNLLNFLITISFIPLSRTKVGLTFSVLSWTFLIFVIFHAFSPIMIIGNWDVHKIFVTT